MAYVILELQTDLNGSTATPPLVTKSTYEQALQAFHATAAVAAVSSVPVHTVVLMTETGEVNKKEICVHGGEE